MWTVSSELTTTSHVVLGLVDLLGKATSYDLKRFVATSIGYFWSFPHSQLYAEPARLAALGLLGVEVEHGGRRRRVYTVTEDGRAALRAWLAHPDPERGEIRDPGLLRLFFSGLARPSDVRELAERQATSYRQSLAELDHIEDAVGGNEAFAFPMLTLELGKRIAHAYIEFWDDVARRHSSSR
jgi:PadR family transcriptional regulator AphA